MSSSLPRLRVISGREVAARDEVSGTSLEGAERPGDARACRVRAAAISATLYAEPSGSIGSWHTQIDSQPPARPQEQAGESGGHLVIDGNRELVPAIAHCIRQDLAGNERYGKARQGEDRARDLLPTGWPARGPVRREDRLPASRAMHRDRGTRQWFRDRESR